MSRWTLEIPGDPVARAEPKIRVFPLKNPEGGWALDKHGKPRFKVSSYPPEKQKNYMAAARDHAQIAMIDERGEPTRSPLVVHVEAVMPIPVSWPEYRRIEALSGIHPHAIKPDVDNFVKMALDICNGIVFHDDAQVVKLSSDKRYCGRDHRTYLKIEVSEWRPK